MSNLRLLVKTNLLNSFELNNFFNKRVRKNGKKNFAAGSSMVVALLLVAVLVSIYFTLIANGLKMVGMLQMFPLMVSSLCVIMCLFTSVFKAQGVLFAARDMESLMSLPVKPEAILASKIIELLIMNYLFVAVVMIPSSIIYFIVGNASVMIFIYALIGIIFVPLLPVVIASVISFFIGYVSSGFKGKNIALIILTVGFVVLTIAGSYKINELVSYIMARSESIFTTIKIVCPSAYYFSDSMINYNMLSMVKLILWSVIPFAVFTLVFGKAFRKINMRFGESYKKSNYKMRGLKVSSQVVSLLKKEVRGYFSSTTYFINTSIGIILVTVAAIASIFLGGDGLVEMIFKSNNSGVSMDQVMPMLLNMIQFAPLVIILFGVSLTCTTGSSISLEGINLWILQSSPIDPMDIFKSKIALNLIIVLPLQLIDTLIFAVVLKLTAVNLFFTLVIPVLITFIVAINGITINLKFPKLRWVTQTQVVKQSLSSGLSMFLGFVIIAVLGLMSFGIYRFTNLRNIYYYLWIIVAILAVILIASVRILRAKGPEMFKKLSL